jgi:hypothetical protein
VRLLPASATRLHSRTQQAATSLTLPHHVKSTSTHGRRSASGPLNFTKPPGSLLQRTWQLMQGTAPAPPCPQAAKRHQGPPSWVPCPTAGWPAANTSYNVQPHTQQNRLATGRQTTLARHARCSSLWAKSGGCFQAAPAGTPHPSRVHGPCAASPSTHPHSSSVTKSTPHPHLRLSASSTLSTAAGLLGGWASGSGWEGTGSGVACGG